MADIFDIKTRAKRTATAVPKNTTKSKGKEKVDGLILTRSEEGIIEALEELREGGGFVALERVTGELYEWIYNRAFINAAKKSPSARRHRAYALLGCCIEDLADLYNDADEVSPSTVARLLRNLARQHQRHWNKKGKK